MFENTGVPLYAQLKYKLLKEIENNYKQGDLLPPESKLIALYKVSRITVRKAMDELERDGIITKKQGRGTYVKEKKSHMTQIPLALSHKDSKNKITRSKQLLWNMK